MKEYSVLVRWRGKAPFNETVDAIPGLAPKEAQRIGEIYKAHKNAYKVEIISNDNGDTKKLEVR